MGNLQLNPLFGLGKKIPLCMICHKELLLLIKEKYRQFPKPYPFCPDQRVGSQKKLQRMVEREEMLFSIHAHRKPSIQENRGISWSLLSLPGMQPSGNKTPTTNTVCARTCARTHMHTFFFFKQIHLGKFSIRCRDILANLCLGNVVKFALRAILNQGVMAPCDVPRACQGCHVMLAL